MTDVAATSYYRMLVLAALFGALSSLLTAAYITLFHTEYQTFSATKPFRTSRQRMALVPVDL